MLAMSEMEDNAYDLAIVDPPYGINAANMQMGTHTTRSGDGYPGTSTASRLKGAGKLKNNILNRSNTDWDCLPPTDEYFKELFRVSKNQVIFGGNYFDLPPTRGMICWDKVQPWENFSQFELAWTSFDKPAAMFRLSNTGGGNHETKIHPTQKPIKLYSWILSKYANEGDIILDTHRGSDSLAIACHNLKFSLDGRELDADYHAAGVKRFEQHKQQLRLF